MLDALLRRFVPDWQNTGDPAVRERYGTLSGIVGIILNLLLFGGKLLAGILTGAISITADAFNNLSDAGSSVVTLASGWRGRRRTPTIPSATGGWSIWRG